MLDQATILRDLVSQTRCEEAEGFHAPAPRMIVVAGAKGGVGTTTIAVNLSIALAQKKHRVLLVDLDIDRGDVAALCGVSPRATVEDVLSGECELAEAIHSGPANVKILPAGWASRVGSRMHDHERLLDQLRTARGIADIVVLDVGVGDSETTHACWQAADEVLLVTTPDDVAVMDAYAAIKVAWARMGPLPIGLIVNRLADREHGEDVQRRIDASCRRFLGISIGAAGMVPDDPLAATAVRSATPAAVLSSGCAAARGIERVAAKCCETM